jgi:hypothetical protein
VRRSTWLVGLVVTGVVGGGAVSASAASGPAPATAAAAAAAPSRPTVLRFDIAFRPQEENFVDIGTPGPGIGDLLVFQDRILASGRQVGVEGGSCTITAILADGFQTHCVGTVSLPGGGIAFQGLVTDKPEKRMAVVGGTGRYRTAAGELTVLELGHDEAGTLTVRLTH